MTTDKQARKEMPIARGVLDYFPDAIAAVANVSFVGNQQHNPGQPMHWARGKSADHADCIARHLIERGKIDDDGLRHTAKAAWRALAELQIELEEAAKPETPIAGFYSLEDDQQYAMSVDLQKLGCPAEVAVQIAGGTTFSKCWKFKATTNPNRPKPYVYIAGPMRGIEKFNFPAFDAARDAFVAKGFNVISPADIDRFANPNTDDTTQDVSDQTKFVLRDFWANYFVRKMDQTGEGGIVLLDNWPKSTGAAGEFFLVRWLESTIYRQDGTEYGAKNALHDFALAHAVSA